jgi:hypothetical protein
MPKWFNLLFEGGKLSRFKNPILKEFYLAFLIGELMVTRV